MGIYKAGKATRKFSLIRSPEEIQKNASFIRISGQNPPYVRQGLPEARSAVPEEVPGSLQGWRPCGHQGRRCHSQGHAAQVLPREDRDRVERDPAGRGGGGKQEGGQPDHQEETARASGARAEVPLPRGIPEAREGERAAEKGGQGERNQGQREETAATAPQELHREAEGDGCAAHRPRQVRAGYVRK